MSRVTPGSGTGSGGGSSTITDLVGIAALGQATMANSLPVVLASNQSAVTVDSELPAAAALGDGDANPTAPAVGSFLMGWNATTWDRIRTGVNNADGISPHTTGVLIVRSHDYLFSQTTNWDRARGMINAYNGTGAGIAAAGLVAQFDDTSPTAITENQFGNVRMSANRNLYGTIRDAAGNERGLNVDANGEIGIGAIRSALPTGTNALGKVGHDITGIGHGVKTITTAGTDEALAGSTTCKRVTVQSQTDNTGLIAVGATGVDATEATGNGVILYPGDTFEIEIDNLADIFIDSTVNGEGVRYTYFT